MMRTAPFGAGWPSTGRFDGVPPITPIPGCHPRNEGESATSTEPAPHDMAFYLPNGLRGSANIAPIAPATPHRACHGSARVFWLPYPAHQPFQVGALWKGESYRVVGCLGHAPDDLGFAVRILNGSKGNLLEEIR